MRRIPALEHMVLGMNRVLSCPLTLKMRTGIYKGVNVAHNVIEKAKLWDVSLFTVSLFLDFSVSLNAIFIV